jgi:recombination protein RecT
VTANLPQVRDVKDVAKAQLDKMLDQFAKVLPPSIPAERFQAVVQTAINKNRDLVVKAERDSLWTACMEAARDGLLPDGREGALVLYNAKEGNAWISKARWMPMVYGIVQKAHKSGMISAMGAAVVYLGDEFKTWTDDSGEHVYHEPCDDPDTNIVRRVFAYVKMKDGTIMVEAMSASEVNHVRETASKAKDGGPWSQWWSEMAKKTAIRRLAKRLPATIDIEGVSKREDDLYDFGAPPRKAESLKGKLDALSAPAPSPKAPDRYMVGVKEAHDFAAASAEMIDEETGEVTNISTENFVASADGKSAAGVPHPSQEESAPDNIGSNHPADPISSGAWTPTNDIGYRQYAESWISNLLDKKSTRFNDEIPLRRTCGVSKETREHLKAMFLAKLDSLPGDDE